MLGAHSGQSLSEGSCRPDLGTGGFISECANGIAVLFGPSQDTGLRYREGAPKRFNFSTMDRRASHRVYCGSSASALDAGPPAEQILAVGI